MSTGMMRRSLQALHSRRWLLSRRVAQIFIIVAFAVEFPKIGRIAAGNLSSSLWLEILPLTDPFVMLQNLLSGAPLGTTALIGAAIVAGFYAFFGGRIYCSWVCPINLLTDAAYWLRQRLNIKGNMSMPRQLRIAVLVVALLLSVLTATVAWEIINPITLFQRELMWTSVAGVTMLLGLFLFDLLISRRGWCGHLCPVGAFYALLGRYGRLRVTVTQPGACSGCSNCIRVCPEPHVLAPVVAHEARSVTSADCTRCGACLDNCPTGTLGMKLQLGKGSTLRSIPIVIER
jgi:ferredoxin-type protein NapH